jgi:hypothetical protein
MSVASELPICDEDDVIQKDYFSYSKRQLHDSHDAVNDNQRLSLGEKNSHMPSIQHPNSVEFLYLPSGEILAKTCSQVCNSISQGPPSPHVPILDMPRFVNSSSRHLNSQTLSPESVKSSKKHSFKSSSTPHQERILELENLLQSEKKRSLEKMRMLLEEQDKSHELQSQVSSFQSKVAILEQALARELSQRREIQDTVIANESRIDNLVAELAQKTKQVDSLQHDLQRLSNEQNVRPHNTWHPPSSPTLSQQGAQTDSSDLDSPYVSLLQAIQAWKDMAEDWCRKSHPIQPLSLENLLMDFPKVQVHALERPLQNSAEHTTIAMLKRRLNFVDQEWRQTHNKYVELKELCARQCVREADLQNFVVRDIMLLAIGIYLIL